MRRHTRVYALVIAASLTLCLFAAPQASAQDAKRKQQTPERTQQPALDIDYTVSMPRPDTHLLQVELRLRWSNQEQAPAFVDLVMPVWTPGSYLVREFERHVQDFAARETGSGARTLTWEKLNKNTWRVNASGAREVRVTYAVYSNELSVRTNELNDRHAFWNNAALLMHPAGQITAPSTLRVVPHRNWKIATGLSPAGERNTFRAENFDTLYDSPFLVGNFKTISFDVSGRQHRIVIDGEGNYDPVRLERDIRKIVETSIALMGGEIPYRDYTFLFILSPRPGGGLEHLNSTAMIPANFGFRPEASYRSFLEVVAHEFFHVWNVKRIRPDTLGPFDYTSENHTRLLWVAEGVTGYYDKLLIRRTGHLPDKEYLEQIARLIETVQATPGRLKVSVEEASFDAWIRYYRPDENSVNASISYYDKGALLGLLLDLEIRRRSNGERSLDDVMRYLYKEFFKKDRNYTPADFQRAAELQAGSSLEDFFRRYVRGRDELDYNAGLAAAGLRLDTTGGTTTPRAHLGANLAQDGERLTVRNVPAGTPAYDQGIYANDQIVAVDGHRASLAFLNARLSEKRPGDTVTLTVFRNEELRTITIKLGSLTEGAYKIVPVKQPTPEQMKTYEAWLGAPFPKTGDK